MVSDKAIRVGLYTKLNVASVTNSLASGSASIRHAVAPPGSAFPFVIFDKVSGVPTRRMGGNAWDDQLWLVKVVDRSESSSVAEDTAKAIDDLLDFGTLSISGGYTLAVLRDSDVDYVETDGDKSYRHCGARYRLSVAAT